MKLTWYTVGSGTPRGRRPGLLCSFGHFREVEDAAKEAKETLYSTDSTSWKNVGLATGKDANTFVMTTTTTRERKQLMPSQLPSLLYSHSRKKLLFHGPFFFYLKLSDREKGKIYLIFLLSLWDIVFREK